MTLKVLFVLGIMWTVTASSSQYSVDDTEAYVVHESVVPYPSAVLPPVIHSPVVPPPVIIRGGDGPISITKIFLNEDRDHHNVNIGSDNSFGGIGSITGR